MWRRGSACARAFSTSAKASDFLPKSSNPTILRLLDAEPIALKMTSGTLIYPRRRLNFANKDSFREIYRETQQSFEDEGNLSYQAAVGYLPAATMGLAMFMRLDMSSWSNWLLELAFIGLGYFYHHQARSQKSKTIRHILITPNYTQLIFGMETFDGTASAQILPSDVTPIKGLHYQKVDLANILFFGYHQTYRRVQQGVMLKQAEKEVEEKLLDMKDNSHLYVKLLKGLTNKEKLLLTVIFYDPVKNKYREGMINPNYNQYEEHEDYLMNLVQKQHMKFFLQPQQQSPPNN